MNTKHFRYSESDGIATLRLDRPDRLNALTFESYGELTRTFHELRARNSVRCVVITGTGRAFCSGGDVKDIIGKLLGKSDAEVAAFTALTCKLIANMRALEKPIIASLNGLTCGAGAVIAAAADVRIASETAKIAFLFTRVGLSGADMGAAWLLPRIVGFGNATELLMTGDFVSAQRAYEIGLYNKVVPEQELASRTSDYSRRLASGPSHGLAITKRMLNQEASMTLADALHAEAWIQAECMKHPDYHESYAAFLEKRPPDFVKNWPRAVESERSNTKSRATVRSNAKTSANNRSRDKTAGSARSNSQTDRITRSSMKAAAVAGSSSRATAVTRPRTNASDSARSNAKTRSAQSRDKSANASSRAKPQRELKSARRNRKA
jgi:enoyl-CoA hydratase/carnithine racemase